MGHYQVTDRDFAHGAAEAASGAGTKMGTDPARVACNNPMDPTESVGNEYAGRLRSMTSPTMTAPTKVGIGKSHTSDPFVADDRTR